LTPEGDSFDAKATVFVRLPEVVDVAFGEDGALYACCHSTRKVFRIRPEE
jgi:hypothetical protein